jgi:hypothetical protein
MRWVIVLVVVPVLFCSAAIAAPITLHGKVLTDEGKAVAGADVWVWRPRPAEAGRTQSSKDGSFQLAVERDDRPVWRIIALADGRAVGSGQVRADRPAPAIIQLAPSSSVRGIVKDADGKPLAGADVRLRRVSQQPDPERPGLETFLADDSPIRCPTGADGRFAIAHVPEGAQADLIAYADGYAMWIGWQEPRVKPAVGGADEDYVIRLKPAAVAEGTVTHEGKPVTGARVFAQGLHETYYWDEAVTDGEGRYRLRYLGSGTYNIALGEVPDLVAPAHEAVKVKGGETYRGLDFRLTPGGLIAGRVIDAQTRKGIAAVEVASYSASRPRSGAACMSARTDETGAYRMRVAPGETYCYYMGGLADYPHAQDASFTIGVQDGETANAPDLVLTRVEPIAVRAIDTAGRPVEGAELVAPSTNYSLDPADADGRIVISGVRPGEALFLAARHPEAKLCGAAMVRDADPQKPIAITLAEPATVKFRLLDRGRQPVVGISVTAWVDWDIPERRRRPGLTMGEATSDAEGTIRLPDLPAGIRLSFASYQHLATGRDWRPRCPTIVAGTVHDLGDVLLDVGSLSIHGTVRLPDGTPAKGAIVRVNLADVEHTIADEQGRFAIGDLVAAEPLLVIAMTRDRSLLAMTEVEPGLAHEPDIVLQESVTIAGQIVDKRGQPQAGRRVIIRPEARGLWVSDLPFGGECATGQDGRFEMEGLVGGMQYRVMAFSRDERGSALLATFTSEPGDNIDLGPLTYRESNHAFIPGMIGSVVVVGIALYVRRRRKATKMPAVSRASRP